MSVTFKQITSSRRFKADVRDMGEASRGLLRLRPVVFRYTRPAADGSHPLQYGLIAEEVMELYPELVGHDPVGRPETVRYELLPAMVLNELQAQHRVVQAQEQRIGALEAQTREVSGSGGAARPAGAGEAAGSRLRGRPGPVPTGACVAVAGASRSIPKTSASADAAICLRVPPDCAARAAPLPAAVRRSR